MAHPAALVSGIIGNIVSFLVFFAPVTTFRQVFRMTTTAGFSSLPYVVPLFSSALWVFYALLKADSHLLVSINSIGCVVEAAYVVFFLLYAPMNGKLRTACYVLLGGAVMAAVLAVTLKGLPPRHRLKFLGSVCLASSTAVFVAPLSVIVKVVRTQSVQFLPVGLSFCLGLSAVAWFCYGLFTKDHFVMYPNVFGFLLSCIQVALYCRYRNNSRNNDGREPPGAQQGGIVEMDAVDAV